MTIDASLFAHIHNDAFLTGTVKLQGNYFKNTITYLNNYCDLLSNSGQKVPAAYTKLIQNLSYLREVELDMREIKADAQTRPLAAKIAHDVLQMHANDNILIPGGWSNSEGGHAMVYQFTPEPEGYVFTVFNAGAGLEHHAKKSIQDKELYNPRKMWSIPAPKTAKEQKELELFISRLVQAKVTATELNPKVEANEAILYEQILPSISYIQGKEINADEKMPEYGYTGGQISGTCTQRSIHQMLKINSDSLETYQHFIFNFKMHSLNEYADACLNGVQPFNDAVADQINLAIDNSLNMLNIPEIFTADEVAEHKKQLISIKEKVAQAVRADIQAINIEAKPAPQLTLSDNYLQVYPKAQADLISSSQKPAIMEDYSSLDLFERLNATISAIQNENDPTIKYVYLEQLVLSLPLTDKGEFTAEVYNSLQSPEDHQAFLMQMNRLQETITTLRRDWLQKAQIPLFNHLSLSVLSLQIDAYEASIPTTGAHKLPSFAPFGDMIMQTFVAQRERDPFEATNNAQADARILALKARFSSTPTFNGADVLDYYQDIIKTEPELDAELTDLYQKTHGSDNSSEHKAIRAIQAQSLFMICSHLQKNSRLKEKFTPLIDKIQTHLAQELEFRKAINPYFQYEKSLEQSLELKAQQKEIRSPVSAFSLAYDRLEKITTHKYNLEDSPARNALEADSITEYAYEKSKTDRSVHSKTANRIQLQGNDKKDISKKPQPITTANITARDYYHLRGNPALQIALTLDYFGLHVRKLQDPNNQRYVEANLFQPGLLAEALMQDEFIPQFDDYLQTGKRYFTQQGQHTPNSMQFFRLDLLVSRYYSQLNPQEGSERLCKVQEDLAKQLSLSSDPKVFYTLQQYLFLATVARIEAGDSSTELLEQAMQSYFHIKRHADPQILGDTNHSIEVERAIGNFRLFASQQPETHLRESVKKALAALGTSLDYGFTGTFPNYTITAEDGSELQVDALRAIVSENGLIKTGIPIAIQHHPLIKQLGLQEINTGLANPQGTEFMIQSKEGSVYLYYKENKLTIHKDWTINGKTARYELQALTDQHEAKHANDKIASINADLPAPLTDGTMNYWKNTQPDAKDGILVRNNIPVYICSSKQIKPISEEPLKQSCQLVALSPNHEQLFNAFESNRFIVALGDTKNTFVQLPRYGLQFRLDTATQTMIHETTGEKVIPTISPIHQSVASLVLEGKEQRRVLVPKMRFYGLEKGVVSDFHPVVHDKNNVITEFILEKREQEEQLAKKPLWDYQDSEQYASFQLVNGEPIADTPAEALYLAYTYLASNQPEKATKTLEECTKRLGGLKGKPDELRYINWICNSLPYLITDNKDPLRGTPPFIACKLKAMSLLSDYLMQGGTYDEDAAKHSPKDANSVYAQYQHEETTNFLKTLPKTIYDNFTKYQTMGRYLEHQYQLSKTERKRLLDYYYQSLPKDAKPLGALGYQWTLLSFEALKEEEKSLLAQQKIGALSTAEKKRLAYIGSQLEKLQDVQAVSTELELVPLDLSLPTAFELKYDAVKKTDKKNPFSENYFLKKQAAREEIENKLLRRRDILTIQDLRKAINILSSDVGDDDFIEHFSAYLKIASSPENPDLRKDLLDFCTHTLIAQRHLPFDKQNSNIPYLCNILYRVAHNHTEVRLGDLQSLLHLALKVEDCVVPPLAVYQAKDVYQQILTNSEQLIAEYKEQAHQPLRTTLVVNQPLVVQMGIEALLTGEEQLNCAAFLDEYQKIQKNLAVELDILGQKTTKGSQEEFALEQQAGKILINAEDKRKELAQRLLDDPTLAQALQKAADQASTQLKTATDTLWDKALELAKEGPDDAKSAQIWNIERASRARETLTKADLLSIYTKADLAYSITRTGLNPEKAQKLHDAIHQALVQGIRQQAAERIKTKLQEAINSAEPTSAMIALEVLAQSDIPALETPAMVLLQHEEQILLRDRQAGALKELLTPSPDGRGFKEVIEKVIMGGGKSKVILPIQAEMKAQGGNLVIVEVPQALLATNHEDLNRTSQRLFGKRAYRFDFNRDSPASPERLEQIYAMFVEVMINKNYLVTTGEAMQSLELKYIELLEAKDPIDEVVEQQIVWLDKITSLVRHHGDCIIDEAHQGLSIKKRLNYTGADKQPADEDAIKNVVALYQLIDPQFIAQAPHLSPDYDWTPFKNELANKLLTDKKSPLYHFAELAIQKYGPEVKQELLSYITNTAKEPCLAVIHANPEEQEMLGLFKQEVGALLPQTLTRNLNEHYGPSKRKNLSSIEKTLALPYAANNVVNEQNRFGNQLESLNYTAQMMLIQGINKKLLIQQIKQWQAAARKELFQDTKLTQIDSTSTAKSVNILLAPLDLKLSEINLEDTQQLQKMHAHLQHNSALIFDMLQEHSLGLVQQEGETISSNSFNHVDMYLSTQAISGTPPDRGNVHQRFHYNKATSLGTDGYIIETIGNKESTIMGHHYKNAAHFIEQILTDPATLGTDSPQAAEKTRAIIDICARFQGISNLEVAQKIVEFYSTKPNTPIRHVLYFDKNQVLCALDINKPNEPIVLKTTDEKEISRLLGSTPDQRFTYYDQSHVVGTDITQEKIADAVVLVDEKTSLQSFLQGCMRMRGLTLEQTLRIVVPEHMQHMPLEELIQLFAKNDDMNLANDNLTAAKLQMTNLMRRQCLAMIRDLPSEEVAQKRQLAQMFHSFLVDKPSNNFYELYGAINSKQPTEDILNHHKEQLMKRWNKCITTAKIKDNEPIEANLQQIIDKALPYCLPEYEATASDSFAKEVQLQAQLQVEAELELAMMMESFDPELKELAEINLFSTQKIHMDHYSLSLNKLCSSKTATDLFSPQLSASKNYAFVYREQTQAVNGFLKPALVTWYYMQEGQLHAMLVTPQEVKELVKKIGPEELKNSWFATNKGTVVGGKRPEGMLKNEQYLALREQVCFFNGEIPALVNQTDFHWLKDRPNEKFDFFKKTLMPYRPGSSEELPLLKTALSMDNKEAYIYIAKHPFEDLSQFSWKKIIPDVVFSRAAEYTRVAEAFTYVNQHWDKEEINFENLVEQFDLPLASLGYVQEHVTLLAKLNNIINLVANSNGQNIFFTRLYAGEQRFLEEYFGMYLNEFTQQYPATDLNALMILRQHPALKGTTKEELFTNMILQNPDCDTKTINALLDSSAKFNDTAWRLILDKPWTETEEALIARKILSREEIDVPQFIIDFVWNQYNKNDMQLINFAEQANCTPFFNKLFSEQKVNDDVLETLAKNPSFSPEKLLFYFLEHHKNEGLTPILSRFEFTTPVLRQCVAQSETSQQLLDLVYSDQANHDLFLDAIVHKKFSMEMLNYISAQSTDDPPIYKELIKTVAMHLRQDDAEKHQWEENLPFIGTCFPRANAMKMFSAALQDIALSKETQLNLLTSFGNQIINSLAFADLVDECTETELDHLLNLPVDYTEAQIQIMINKASTATQIAQLLNHPKITSTMAADLFANPGYDHKIENWAWLTEQQLLDTLSKTNDFDSLQRALHHENLSKSARTQWLDTAIKQHQKNKTSEDPKQKIEYQLESLRILVYKHAITGTKTPAYNDAAKTALELYATLHKETTAYFSQTNPDIDHYKANCKKAFERAEPVLETHRGYKQKALDVVNVILAYVTFSPPPKDREEKDWRYFKAKTASMQQLKKAADNIDDLEKPNSIK